MSIRPLFGRAAGAFATALALGVLAARAHAAGAAPKAPATGRVHYQMSSPMMQGTMVMAWIDHGKKFRQDMKLAVNAQGRQMSVDGWTLADGTYLYTHQQPMGNQVMRLRMPKSASALAGLPGVPSPGQIDKGKIVGKGTVLGHSCEIRSFGRAGSQGKVWFWNSIPLKVEAAGPQGPGMRLVATQVETAPKLSPGLFKLPAGLQVHDVQLPTGKPGHAAGRPH